MSNRNAMKMCGVIGSLVLALAVFSSRAIAEELAPAPAHATNDAHSAAAFEDARPVVPVDSSPWVGSMLIIIVAMFLMAAVIGPMVRIEIPVEEPDAHGHDDHGHGHSDHGHGH